MTTEFAQLAAVERVGLGLAVLPITVVEHPLGDQSPEGVQAKADAVIDDIVHVLTTLAEQLAEEERGKTYAEPKTLFRSKSLFT